MEATEAEGGAEVVTVTADIRAVIDMVMTTIVIQVTSIEVGYVVAPVPNLLQTTDTIAQARTDDPVVMGQIEMMTDTVTAVIGIRSENAQQVQRSALKAKLQNLNSQKTNVTEGLYLCSSLPLASERKNSSNFLRRSVPSRRPKLSRTGSADDRKGVYTRPIIWPFTNSVSVGYVEFKQEESVPLAIQLTGQKLLGLPIIAQLTEAEKNRQARNPEATSGNHNSIPFHRLYVGNIHFSITESDLQNVFEPFGELEFVQLQKEEMGRSRGYGFVQYVNIPFSRSIHANES